MRSSRFLHQVILTDNSPLVILCTNTTHAPTLIRNPEFMPTIIIVRHIFFTILSHTMYRESKSIALFYLAFLFNTDEFGSKKYVTLSSWIESNWIWKSSWTGLSPTEWIESVQLDSFMYDFYHFAPFIYNKVLLVIFKFYFSCFFSFFIVQCIFLICLRKGKGW